MKWNGQMVRALPAGTGWLSIAALICLMGAGVAQTLELHSVAQFGLFAGLVSADVVVAFIAGRVRWSDLIGQDP